MHTLYIVKELLAITVLAIALGTDAFSIGLSMGLQKMRRRQILAIGLVVGAFHMIMPTLGILTGSWLSANFEEVATYIGGSLMVLLGANMVLMSIMHRSEEEKRTTPIGLGLFIFSFTVSIDSFSIGLSLGLFGSRALATIIIFGLTAAILTWLGLILGKKVKGTIGSYGEVIGGILLLLYGLKMII